MESDSGQGKGRMTRRNFLAKSASAAGFMIVPRRVLGGPLFQAPSDTLNIAAVGLFGMGQYNVQEVTTENIVALCDVDPERCAEIFKKYPGATTYVDFREMLDKQKDIDAVIIATPDHMHAPISMAAMQLGKHVYTQKPLTRLVYEARALAKAAEMYGVQTQMGNQQNSGERIRLTAEWLQAGAIGTVREAHVWTDRPIWPQGIPTPTDTPPLPKGLAWDLWCGVSPVRTFHPFYHPFSWRGWWDFGSGALGDIGCHSMDYIFFALKLGAPKSVWATISRPQGDENPMDVFPRASTVEYLFPERDGQPSFRLSWYDGGLVPRLAEELGGEKIPNGGILFVGDKGMMAIDGERPRLIPESLNQSFVPPAPSIKRIETSHEMSWVNACKGGDPPSSNFAYAGPLAEAVLVGNLAVRYPNQVLEWDPVTMEITNHPEASAYVRAPYRDGWSL